MKTKWKEHFNVSIDADKTFMIWMLGLSVCILLEVFLKNNMGVIAMLGLILMALIQIEQKIKEKDK